MLEGLPIGARVRAAIGRLYARRSSRSSVIGYSSRAVGRPVLEVARQSSTTHSRCSRPPGRCGSRGGSHRCARTPRETSRSARRSLRGPDAGAFGAMLRRRGLARRGLATAARYFGARAGVDIAGGGPANTCSRSTWERGAAKLGLYRTIPPCSVSAHICLGNVDKIFAPPKYPLCAAAASGACQPEFDGSLQKCDF
eukprot:2427161-Pyramimonas_sp.AAC.1